MYIKMGPSNLYVVLLLLYDLWARSQKVKFEVEYIGIHDLQTAFDNMLLERSLMLQAILVHGQFSFTFTLFTGN